MKNIFDRAYSLAIDTMDVFYGELFTPIVEDEQEIKLRLKQAMLKRNGSVTLTGLKTLNEYEDSIVTNFENVLTSIARNLGELV